MDSHGAQELAERHLADSLPLRWRHSQGVAATAVEYATRVGLDLDPLVAAAWLHDLGYAPTIKDAGFHPVDGARYLRREGWPDEVVNLVATTAARESRPGCEVSPVSLPSSRMCQVPTATFSGPATRPLGRTERDSMCEVGVRGP